MNPALALAAVLLLVGAGLAVGALGAVRSLFDVAVPYLALAVFTAGVVAQVVRWGRSPVPFRIPTTCGQQRALPWIRNDALENPHTGRAVLGRMFLEVCCFRSLLRNTRARLAGDRLVHAPSLLLWCAAIAFHYSLLAVLLRHLRYALEPVPAVVGALERADGLLRAGLPTLYLSDAALVGALACLLGRRLLDARLRRISLPADYFAPLLIGGIAVTGILMRSVARVDATAVKRLAVGWARFAPSAPDGLGPLFHAHLLLACALLAFFPFSKLLHAPGAFLSPTRNLANTSRERRHVNPWHRPVRARDYAAWEAEFRDALTAAKIPLDGPGRE